MDKPFLHALTQFVECQNSQDIQGILRLMHVKSFAYKQTQQTFLSLFATFELQTTLLRMVFIAKDNDYAYARLKLKTEKTGGPDFRNNVTEFLVVFRLMDDAWKIWWLHPLTFELL